MSEHEQRVREALGRIAAHYLDHDALHPDDDCPGDDTCTCPEARDCEADFQAVHAAVAEARVEGARLALEAAAKVLEDEARGGAAPAYGVAAGLVRALNPEEASRAG